VGPIPPSLERPLRPVADVLVHTGANAAARADALGIVAHELHRRRRTVWAWTAADWLETLGPALDQFRRRHRVGGAAGST
jgi:hypothetical protein